MDISPRDQFSLPTSASVSLVDVDFQVHVEDIGHLILFCRIFPTYLNSSSAGMYPVAKTVAEQEITVTEAARRLGVTLAHVYSSLNG